MQSSRMTFCVCDVEVTGFAVKMEAGGRTQCISHWSEKGQEKTVSWQLTGKLSVKISG